MEGFERRGRCGGGGGQRAGGDRAWRQQRRAGGRCRGQRSHPLTGTNTVTGASATARMREFVGERTSACAPAARTRWFIMQGAGDKNVSGIFH